MIQNTIIFGDSTNPWHNLALEEALFENHSGGALLYLWRNSRTVVIGRNQNAWKECRVEALERDGGKLARRSSGGGAVYHDLGNLNFTFILPREEYNLERQLGVILRAVQELGINAHFSGRNDIVGEDGAKFSGNAFRFSQKNAMHHGTLLVDVDLARMAKYLSPPKEKLRTKGVESVRARVCNLNDIKPGITGADAWVSIAKAFTLEYGHCRAMNDKDVFVAALSQREDRHASWDWRMGSSPAFDVTLENRFAWGSLEIGLTLEKGIVKMATVYSDAMDEAFILSLPAVLKGQMFKNDALAAAVRTLDGEYAQDIAAWLGEIKL